MTETDAHSQNPIRCGIFEWCGGVDEHGDVHLRQGTSHRAVGLANHTHRFRIPLAGGTVFWTGGTAPNDEDTSSVKERIHRAAQRQGLTLSGSYRDCLAEWMASMDQQAKAFAAEFTRLQRAQSKPKSKLQTISKVRRRP